MISQYELQARRPDEPSPRSLYQARSASLARSTEFATDGAKSAIAFVCSPRRSLAVQLRCAPNSMSGPNGSARSSGRKWIVQMSANRWRAEAVRLSPSASADFAASRNGRVNAIASDASIAARTASKSSSSQTSPRGRAESCSSFSGIYRRGHIELTKQHAAEIRYLYIVFVIAFSGIK